MPYCLYLRKSRADMESKSRGKIETLARHQKFIKRYTIITNKINAAKKSMKALIADLHFEILKNENQKVIIPKAEKILELYTVTEDPSLRNQLLRELILKAVYIKKVNGRWHNNLDDFELILYTKLPTKS